jgi:quercetin dioxygenase-like cupin family protein
MTVKHSQQVEAMDVSGGVKTTRQVLISLQEAPNFALRRFIMQPGGGMPRHTNTVEHEQYVLTGQAHITIGDEEFDVQAGDVVFIPEGMPHSYQNTGSGTFEFLCVVPNKQDVSTILPGAPAC